MSDQDMAWQTLLQGADDAMGKELLCVQRRYHGQIVESEHGTDGGVRTRCFMALSDPDLAPEFKGESEIFVVLPATYPQDAAQLDLSSWKKRMTDTQFAALNAAVAARAEELRGMYGIRKLLTWLDNNILRILQASAPPVDIEQEYANKELTVEEEEEAKDEEPRSQKACRYLMRGQCKSGDKCRFSHEKAKELKKKKLKKQAKQEGKETVERVASPVDANAVKETNKNESEAVLDDGVAVESPQKKTNKKTKKKKEKKPKKQQPCKFFSKSECRDGDQCRFSHEQLPYKPTSTTQSSVEQANGTDKKKPPAKKKPGITIAVIGQAPASPGKPHSDDVAPAVLSPVEPTVEAVPSPEDWTAEQQRALDHALKTHPATMEKRDRWIAIASEVEGKSLNDCIDRFKLLTQLVKTGAPIPIAPTPTIEVASVSPPPSSPPRTSASSAKRDVADDQQKAIAAAAIHAKIIPDDKRVPIETEPEITGSQIRLEELFLFQIGTLIPHRIVCQVQCTHCPLKFDATLALDDARLQKWCPRCSTKHVVALRPVFTHAQSNVLAYVDTENCAVVDVLPSDVLASCLECGTEALLEKIVPGRRFEQSCFSCHTKLAMMTKRVAVGYVASGEGMAASTSSSSSGAAGASGSSTTKTKRVVDTFVLGQPLPRNGACDHYKHSQRWFRFQCCGKAFPCDVCHDSSDCEHANTGKIASKMICGLCSKEQASSIKECSCGNEMGRHVTRTRHWEGGAGCRDPTKMAAGDRQKFRGKNKTESQKHKRVGIAGKLRTLHTAAD